jgi:hypothetical protein
MKFSRLAAIAMNVNGGSDENFGNVKSAGADVSDPCVLRAYSLSLNSVRPCPLSFITFGKANRSPFRSAFFFLTTRPREKAVVVTVRPPSG